MRSRRVLGFNPEESLRVRSLRGGSSRIAPPNRPTRPGPIATVRIFQTSEIPQCADNDDDRHFEHTARSWHFPTSKRTSLSEDELRLTPVNGVSIVRVAEEIDLCRCTIIHTIAPVASVTSSFVKFEGRLATLPSAAVACSVLRSRAVLNIHT